MNKTTAHQSNRQQGGGMQLGLPGDFLLQSRGVRGVELDSQTHGEGRLGWREKRQHFALEAWGDVLRSERLSKKDCCCNSVNVGTVGFRHGRHD